MPACLRICFFRLFSIVPALVLFVLLAGPGPGPGPGTATAQTHFVPLERGDVSERKEHLIFSPGVELSGDYRLRISKINSTSLPE